MPQGSRTPIIGWPKIQSRMNVGRSPSAFSRRSRPLEVRNATVSCEEMNPMTQSMSRMISSLLLLLLLEPPRMEASSVV